MSNQSPLDPRLDPKQLILRDLHLHLDRRIRRTRVLRVTGSATAVLALCAAAYLALRTAPPSAPGPRIAVHPAPIDPPAPKNPAQITAVEQTQPDPTVSVRIAASDPLPLTPCEAVPSATLCILSDDQLLTALAEAGRPSSLIRTGGEAYIVPIEGSRPLR